MNQKQFNKWAGIVFVLGGSLHAFRLVKGLDLFIGDWLAPAWLSAVGVVGAFYLAYYALKKLS
jgi:drug/metabolite transporter (DMT)-like permease